MLYLGADHRGFSLKEHLKKWLFQKNIAYKDLGNKLLDPEDDYVDFAALVAKKVVGEKESRGIVICGSGVGVCLVANKIKGIRCGLIINQQMAEQARSHDDINVVALPADFIKEKQTEEIVEVFLNTPFSGKEKYKRRLEKIVELEAN